MNWKIDEPYEYKGVEHSNRFEQLLFRALIKDQISISKAASLNNQTLADFRKDYQIAFLFDSGVSRSLTCCPRNLRTRIAVDWSDSTEESADLSAL